MQQEKQTQTKKVHPWRRPGERGPSGHRHLSSEEKERLARQTNEAIEEGKLTHYGLDREPIP